MRQAAVLLAFVAALSLAGAALADQWQIHRTAAGNAAARAAVITKADIGTNPGWTGGFVKPDLNSSPPCSFQPKQSDLVVIGAASSVWKHSGLELESDANVLKTQAMVRLDWQRSVLDPRSTPCLRKTIAKTLPAGATIVSFGVASLPRLAPLQRRYRAVVTVSGTKLLVDLIAMGKNGTEIQLSTIAPLAAESIVRPAEFEIARRLAGRVRA